MANQHNKSILHLDLKPGNVLLTWDDGRIMYVCPFDFVQSSPHLIWPAQEPCYLTSVLLGT